MNNLSSPAKAYILSLILIGAGLAGLTLVELDWATPGLYLLAALGAVAQTLKLEGPNARTNYSIAWFVYGFAFIALGPGAALFVVVVSHLVEWIWHKYPWYIQTFNIGAHGLPVFLAGLVFTRFSRGTGLVDLAGVIGLVAANLVFVLGNHFLVGMVVKVARGQSFAESGVFEFLTLFLDFAVLTLGAVTALTWSYNPFLSALNIPLLYPLYRALRLPALLRQLQQEMKKAASPVGLD